MSPMKLNRPFCAGQPSCSGFFGESKAGLFAHLHHVEAKHVLDHWALEGSLPPFLYSWYVCIIVLSQKQKSLW